MLIPIAQVRDRIERAQEDSDVAYFYELLNAGEMALKVTGAALVACLEPDRERHRYRLEYDLVRIRRSWRLGGRDGVDLGVRSPRRQPSPSRYVGRSRST